MSLSFTTISSTKHLIHCVINLQRLQRVTKSVLFLISFFCVTLRCVAYIYMSRFFSQEETGMIVISWG